MNQTRRFPPEGGTTNVAKPPASRITERFRSQPGSLASRENPCRASTRGLHFQVALLGVGGGSDAILSLLDSSGAMTDQVPRPSEAHPPRWKAISSLDRRVAGVLVEKAKTTPDGYPMTLSGLKAGCNQKTNRYPLMEVEQEDIEEALERLRAAGAVTEVQGSGRVAKYRHHMYEWLGVDKVELAVMTELLLRGAQTEGELRGRAARMDPIPDLPALRPVLESLIKKNLVISLTPEGRGHVVTHNLYEPRELEKVKNEYQAMATAAASPAAAPIVRVAQEAVTAVEGYVHAQDVAALRREVEELRAQVEQLRKDHDEMWSSLK